MTSRTGMHIRSSREKNVGIMQCSFSFVTAVVIAQRREKMSPVNCEIREFIRFLHAQKQSPKEIHRQLCYVYGPDFTSDIMVRRRCGQFTKGRTTVHDVDRGGRSSLMTPELLESVR